ncbi:hypothetical protein N657DRAFT_647817 [Parathielavia appendiculata]|uniref:Uncharacterized protein n=1 Tax=Parathielavia appendiculata TaxID=2587402 RepID=A0AAN6TVR8_9PEZI|nr:hypothetical protein N657DRAFT_647817 [Parathielavia appendiculata]
MDDQKTNANVRAATRLASCTSLERRLASWCYFLSTLVLNAVLRMFVWPHVSGSPYLILVVIGTRIVVGVSWVRLHPYLTGEERIGPLFTPRLGFYPLPLSILCLGAAIENAGSKNWVAQGYCKQADLDDGRVGFIAL